MDGLSHISVWIAEMDVLYVHPKDEGHGWPESLPLKVERGFLDDYLDALSPHPLETERVFFIIELDALSPLPMHNGERVWVRGPIELYVHSMDNSSHPPP
jgi:hypothetical protein